MLRKLSVFVLIFQLFLFGRVFSSTLRIDQPSIRLIMTPGSSKAGAIKVENISNSPMDIKVYLEDWYYVPPFDGSKEFKPAGTVPLSAAKWITFVPAEFTVPAFGRQMVNFTVNLPTDATGGHYAVMFFETQIGEVPKEEGVFVNVLGRMASLFLIQAEGTINKSCEIKNFSLTRISKDSPLEIGADFHNSGNVLIKTGGTYYIIDKEGIVYARGEFNEVYTLPDDTARIKASWQEPIPAGRYDIVLTLDLGEGKPKVSEASFQIDSKGAIVNVGNLK